MQGITPKQERFAIEYVATGNASEAYRRSYDAENMSAEAIWVEASRMMDNPTVSLRVNEEKAKALGSARITASMILARAWEIAQQNEKDRVSALSVAARAFPEFRDTNITVDNRSLVVEGLSIEELKQLVSGS